MLPALEAAVSALDSLNKADIIEMKTFIKPPALVQLTMEGVCILLQVGGGWGGGWVTVGADFCLTTPLTAPLQQPHHVFQH